MNRPRWLRVEVLPAVIAIAMLLYRFCNLDLTTFINDEPHLLAAAETEAHGGGWVSASPIPGTQGLHYGPVPTWLYGVVHSIFGSSPLASIVAMGLVVTLGQLVFLGLLTKFVRGGPTLFGALLALAASSPFAFAWSRTAWDNTILIGAFSCGALLLAENPLSARRALVAGTLLGISIGTHLMVLPVVVILLALTAWSLCHDPKNAATRLAQIGAPIVVVNAPYIFYLTQPHDSIAQAASTPSIPHVRPPFDIGDALSTIVTTFLAPARVFTTAGISYFFDDAWAEFRASLGAFGLVLAGAWIALILAAVSIAGITLSLRKNPSSRLQSLARLALFSWIGYALFLLVDGLAPHPHYQHPVWWTIPTGIALLFVRYRDRSEKKAPALVAAVWLIALAQFSFLPMWMHWIRENDGTRGIHFTTPLAAEQTWMKNACATAGNLQIENHTVVFASALDYLAKNEPACRGRDITICSEKCADSSARTIALRYAAEVGGHLASPP